MITEAITDLIVLACRIANPDVCERHVIASDQPVMSCVMASPALAAEWAGARPKWRVERVECRKHMADA